jgi:tetratricopeptide (TPR) repeat protein
VGGALGAEPGPGGSDPGELRLRLLLCALGGGVVFFAVCFPILCTDIWWHLAAGRLIVEQGRFLYTDPFSSGSLGARWVDVHWLFQVLAWGAYRLGGLPAIVLAKALAASGAAALLLAVAFSETPRPLWPAATLVVIVVIYSVRHLVLDRPIVLTLLAMSLFLAVLERPRRERSLRVLLALVPLQIAWANWQGLAILGPVMWGCTLAGEAVAALGTRGQRAAPAPRRALLELTVVGGLLLAGLFATPYGWGALELPFKLFGRIEAAGSDVFAYNVTENIPPWVLERSTPDPVAHFKWLAAVTFASFLIPRGRGSSLGRFLLLAACFGLALLANRNILLFAWIAAPTLASNLAGAPALARRAAPLLSSSRKWRAALLSVCLAGLGALVLHRAREASAEPPLDEPTPFRVPVEAVRRLEAAGLPGGGVFNSVRYGGYIAFALYPRARPIIDGRLVIRTAAQFAEHLALADNPESFERYRAAHDLRAAILPTAYPDRYLPLVVALYRDPAWRLVYTDGTQTLFVRNGPRAPRAVDLSSSEVVRAIDADLSSRHRRHAAILERARSHLGRLLAEVGAYDRAEEVLSSLVSPGARVLRARVAYLAGEPARAEELARAALATHPDEVDSLILLALLALDRGDHARTLDLLERALAADPYNLTARRLLDRVAREARGSR